MSLACWWWPTTWPLFLFLLQFPPQSSSDVDVCQHNLLNTFAGWARQISWFLLASLVPTAWIFSSQLLLLLRNTIQLGCLVQPVFQLWLGQKRFFVSCWRRHLYITKETCESESIRKVATKSIRRTCDYCSRTLSTLVLFHSSVVFLVFCFNFWSQKRPICTVFHLSFDPSLLRRSPL